MSKIFIQIASYRDPELLPTIEDALAKAEHPENLTFGICNQTDNFNELDLYRDDVRFQIIDVKWNESKGTCWARHLVQKLWNGEEYTLQLDSHHRFAQNWDTQLIDFAILTDSPKPLLTAYVCGYNPKKHKEIENYPLQLNADYFTEENILLLQSSQIPNGDKLSRPIPGRFISGHFIFTLGIFNKEVEYDPSLYFHGEEITLSVRAFTHGYDIFYPHKNVIWHEYTREGRDKHWDDHAEENQKKGLIELQWWERDVVSKEKIKTFFQTSDPLVLGKYGLGYVRSLADYEFYAGVKFSEKALHQKTIDGLKPPVNDPTEWWSTAPKQYNFNLALPPITREDYTGIFLGIEDVYGELLYREDITTYQHNIDISFMHEKEPFRFVYWPYNDAGFFDRKDIIL